MKEKSQPKIIDTEINKVGKTGDSLYLTIPARFRKKVNLSKGDFCKMDLLDNDSIIIRKQE